MKIRTAGIVSLGLFLLLLITIMTLTTACGNNSPTSSSTPTNTPIPSTPTVTSTPTNPVSSRLYVSNNTDGTVSVINTTNNTVVTTIQNVGTNPGGLTTLPSLGKVFVTDLGSPNLYVINGVTNSVAATISLPSDSGACIADTNTNLIYVPVGTNSNATSILVFNGSTNAAVTSIAVGGTSLQELGISPSNSLLYVSDSGASGTQIGAGLHVISTTSFSQTAFVSFNNTPHGMSLDSANNKLYVAQVQGNMVQVINTTTNSISTSFPTGNAPYNFGILSSAGMGYEPNGNDNTVWAINLSNYSSAATITVGSSPQWLVVNPSLNCVYVPNQNSQNVSVISTASNTVIATITVGNGPVRVALIP